MCPAARVVRLDQCGHLASANLSRSISRDVEDDAAAFRIDEPGLRGRNLTTLPYQSMPVPDHFQIVGHGRQVMHCCLQLG